MSIWFVIWLLISAALLYFTGWTFLILQRQKRAWKVYAAKYKLRYEPGTLMASPTVNGVMEDYTVGIFVGEHMSSDARRSRKMTAVEIRLNSHMPTNGALASGDMVPLVQDQGFKNEMRPEHPDWQVPYIAAADNKAVLEAYLTPARLEALTGLMKIKNSAVILIFRDEAMLLRVDTPDPMETPQKLDKLVRQMLDAARVLEFDGALPKED